jgi:hypothetical protein
MNANFIEMTLAKGTILYRRKSKREKIMNNVFLCLHPHGWIGDYVHILKTKNRLRIKLLFGIENNREKCKFVKEYSNIYPNEKEYDKVYITKNRRILNPFCDILSQNGFDGFCAKIDGKGNTYEIDIFKKDNIEIVEHEEEKNLKTNIEYTKNTEKFRTYIKNHCTIYSDNEYKYPIYENPTFLPCNCLCTAEIKII